MLLYRHIDMEQQKEKPASGKRDKILDVNDAIMEDARSEIPKTGRHIGHLGYMIDHPLHENGKAEQRCQRKSPQLQAFPDSIDHGLFLDHLCKIMPRGTIQEVYTGSA